VSRTYVYIVCSPLGRVGTTTTARLFADYFLWRSREFTGFDTDAHETPFAARFPGLVDVADLSTVKGQMFMFDSLLVNDAPWKVVDLWSRSWRQFCTLAYETGFVDEALRLDVEPVFVLVVDSSEESRVAAETIQRLWPELNMILVRNLGALEKSESEIGSWIDFPSVPTLEIPALDPIIAQFMERGDLSLSKFHLSRPPGVSIVLRSGIDKWLAHIFQDLHRLELRLSLRSIGSLG
jgi:hypothetical protein